MSGLVVGVHCLFTNTWSSFSAHLAKAQTCQALSGHLGGWHSHISVSLFSQKASIDSDKTTFPCLTCLFSESNGHSPVSIYITVSVTYIIGTSRHP